MTQKEEAFAILSNFDLEIDFAYYFYAIRAKYPTISRAEIISYYNEWQESNGDECGDRYTVFPKAWQTEEPDGTITVQIPQ